MPLNAFYCNCLGTSSTFAQMIQIVLKPQPQAEKISPEMEYPLISTEFIGLRVNLQETLQICGFFPEKTGRFDQ